MAAAELFSVVATAAATKASSPLISVSLCSVIAVVVESAGN